MLQLTLAAAGNGDAGVGPKSTRLVLAGGGVVLLLPLLLLCPSKAGS